MALNVYRRHRRHCYGGHAEDSSSSFLQERAKGWKRCDCDVHVSGTLAGRYARKTTGAADWEQARLVVERLERAGLWTVDASPLAPPAPEPTAPPVPEPTPAAPKARCEIPEALQVFVAHKTASGIKAPTLRTYRTFKKRLGGFAAQRGYQMIDEVTAIDIDVFWAGWTLGPRAKSNRLTTLRGFFRFCLHRKWIAESPVSPDIKPPVGASRPANKAPFTDEELDRILAACDDLHVDWKNEMGEGEWTGDDLKDLIWLMIHTGYRISDATFFDITRLHGNQIFIRATKNGADVFAYLPNWLCARLRARATRCGRRPFLVGRSRRLETVTNTWRRRLAKAFVIAGPFEEPATPHRFRHTFARLLLGLGSRPLRPVPAGCPEWSGRTEDTMTRTARQNASAPAYLLANAGGVLLRRIGGWTLEPSEAKTFREVTPELFEVAELFDVSVIKLSTTGDVGQIEIYSATTEYAAVEIRKRRGAAATFRIRSWGDEEFILSEEVEDHIACLRLALALAHLLP